MAVALPVAPTLGLKSSVFAAVGIGGGAAAGGGAVVGGASLAGAAKIAAVALVAASGTAVVVAERDASTPSSTETPAVRSADPAGGNPAAAAEAAAGVIAGGANGVAHGRREHGSQPGAKRRGHGKESAPGQLKGKHERATPVKPEHAGPKGERGPKAERGPKTERAPKAQGRGPIEAPPADTPVQRGPAEPKVKEPKVTQPAPESQGQAQAPEERGPKLK
jgi:hypothetical protein